MPHEETSPDTTATETLTNQPDAEELHYKTLAFKLDEGAHAQLHFIAQLRGSTAAGEARRAIQTHLEGARQDPDLIERADRARQTIEREAAARANAIAGFMGTAAVASGSGRPAPGNRKNQS